MLRQDKKYMAIYLPHFSWLAATAIALSSITTTVAAAEFKVFSIGDGDTIRMSSSSGTTKTTLRLACIDAPETSQAPYGNYQTSTGAIWCCFCLLAIHRRL
jgi:endonuclease YncB( thermonuclease family)